MTISYGLLCGVMLVVGSACSSDTTDEGECTDTVVVNEVEAFERAVEAMTAFTDDVAADSLEACTNIVTDLGAQPDAMTEDPLGSVCQQAVDLIETRRLAATTFSVTVGSADCELNETARTDCLDSCELGAPCERLCGVIAIFESTCAQVDVDVESDDTALVATLEANLPALVSEPIELPVVDGGAEIAAMAAALADTIANDAACTQAGAESLTSAFTGAADASLIVSTVVEATSNLLTSVQN